ncbi:MAG: gas vesicle protein [Methanotrichaceae archaeon]|nr:gas vesicle protein [Methanotrichaceae archaeon]
MNPERESCLVEVLDRLLNRGVILNADLIITVAGVPLIGLNLRAALASMETMLQYGVMDSWDRRSRDSFTSSEVSPPLQEGEHIILKSFGYVWQNWASTGNWIPGSWYLTSRRLLLWRKSPGEAVFEISLERIQILKVVEAPERERSELDLLYSGGVARIYVSDLEEFRSELYQALASARALVS